MKMSAGPPTKKAFGEKKKKKRKKAFGETVNCFKKLSSLSTA